MLADARAHYEAKDARLEERFSRLDPGALPGRAGAEARRRRSWPSCSPACRSRSSRTSCRSFDGLDRDGVAERLIELAREQGYPAEFQRQIERYVLLEHIDRHWREHLDEMDYLREGIHLRGMAQKDPLVEYRVEGHSMFE